MFGMYVLVGLIVVGLVALIYFRARLNRSDKTQASSRAAKIGEQKAK